MPGMPSVLIHTGSGARLVSTLFSSRAGRTAYSCMPSGPMTWSPGAKPGSLDADDDAGAQRAHDVADPDRRDVGAACRSSSRASPGPATGTAP